MVAVRKVCRITMETLVKAAMHVHQKDATTVMKFKEYRSGLYYYNTGPKNSMTSEAYLSLNTIAKSKGTGAKLKEQTKLKHYTKR
jgi:uncharacterized protein (DUF2164 family)